MVLLLFHSQLFSNVHIWKWVFLLALVSRLKPTNRFVLVFKLNSKIICILWKWCWHYYFTHSFYYLYFNLNILLFLLGTRFWFRFLYRADFSHSFKNKNHTVTRELLEFFIWRTFLLICEINVAELNYLHTFKYIFKILLRYLCRFQRDWSKTLQIEMSKSDNKMTFDS